MYEKLNGNAKKLMMLTVFIACVIETVVCVVVWFFIRDIQFSISPNWIWFLVALLWIIEMISPFVRYERFRYRFTEEEIDVREGFLFVRRDIVPIERLHKISMNAGPFDRMFGLAKVVVTTAGGDVTIRFLENQKAEDIVEHLKKKINQYAVQSRKWEAEHRAKIAFEQNQGNVQTGEATEEKVASPESK